MDNSESAGELIIRDYQEKDYDEIASLWHLTGMGNLVRNDSPDIILRTLEYKGRLLVMEDLSEGKIVGTSWMTYDGRRIMIHHFGILPDYQGRGLSKILLKKSLEYVKEIGAQVKLEVHAANTKAINLYKKFGFVQLGEYDIYIIRDVLNL
jgi:[ribosomal protein S18]-alanine N-acetyltransferase